MATTLNHIGAGTYKSRPSAETVRAVAYLAGVSDDEAFTAAGLPIPGPPFADELPPDADELSPRSRKAVIEVIRAMLAAERGHQPPVEADLPLVIPVAADLEGEVSGQEPVTDHRQQVGV
ncbi:MAG: hypothetical protein FWG11_06120 [Promicromonosporaceae bacterium]|nr:hypothetical protein [Promicromonosporaceae bacterium]